MKLIQKPLKWDDLAARHDPQSLPFWRFYEEAEEARQVPSLAVRMGRWLRGIDDSALEVA